MAGQTLGMSYLGSNPFTLGWNSQLVAGRSRRGFNSHHVPFSEYY
jgi:hypothetical protein